MARSLAPVLCLLSALWVAADARAQAFVRTQGTHFVVDGKPLRFVGANVSVIHGPNERREMDAVLDAAAADGLKVVRVWALGELREPRQPHYPLYAFRIGSAGWVEDSFTHLDRVLASARARGLRVILVLANRWKDYGGIGSYLAWAGKELPLDPRGELLGAALGRFYRCERCAALYLEHVERLVARTNSVTGVPYRDDPTIFSWELINEVSAITADAEDALVTWVSDSARFIRARDPNHLIAAGHIGYATQHERRVWRRVQALPEIGYADAHAYPTTDPRVSSLARLRRWIDDRVNLGHSLGKPFIFGEFGFEGGRGRARLRSRFTRAFLEESFAAGASGALIWQYEPASNPARAHTILAGPEDAASLRVRGLLSTVAASLPHTAAPAHRPSQKPRFTFATTLTGPRFAHRAFRAEGSRHVLDIDPLAFARASFERAGTYERGPFELVYGAGSGEVQYRFVSPAIQPQRLQIAARISSELPGHGVDTDARDGSDVQVLLDDIPLGVWRAPPDDGLGEVLSLDITDPALLVRIFRRRHHRLTLRALPSQHAGGLCIYGRPSGHFAIPPALRREVDSVRITLSEAAPSAKQR